MKAIAWLHHEAVTFVKTADALAELADDEQLQDLMLTRIDGGFRLKLSDDGRHFIDVLEMIYNWRICETPVRSPLEIDRAWCYFAGEKGTKADAFRRAVRAAWLWDGAPDSEPEGYDKRVGAW